MATIPVIVATTTAGDVLRSSEENIQSCHTRSHWLDSLLTCYLWYDGFLWNRQCGPVCRPVTRRDVDISVVCRNVNCLCFIQVTGGSLQLSSGSCGALPPAPQNCNLIQTRTSKSEPSLSMITVWLLACVTSSFNQLVATQNNIPLSSWQENVICVLH